MTGRLHFSGLPTAVDVRALYEAFGVPQEGVSIPYSAIEDVLKVPAWSTRWRTVTSVWRAQLWREERVSLKAESGAFTRRNPSELVDAGACAIQAASRRLKFGEGLIGSADRSRLSDEYRARADGLLLRAAAMKQAARLAEQKPVISLPKAVDGQS